MDTIIAILVASGLPKALIILGVVCVAIAIVGRIRRLNLDLTRERAVALGAFGIALILLAIGAAWVLTSVPPLSTIAILVSNTVPVILIILGIVCVAIAIVASERAVALGAFGIVLILLAIGAAWVLTPPCSNNLLACKTVEVFTPGKSVCNVTPTSGGLVVNFDTKLATSATAVSFLLNPPLNLQGKINIELTGTSTKDFTFTIELKKIPTKVAQASAPQPFKANQGTPQTILIPITYSDPDAIVEVVIDFTVPGRRQASTFVINSMQIK